MVKMGKNIITFILAVSFLIESTDSSYALRPAACQSSSSKTAPAEALKTIFSARGPSKDREGLPYAEIRSGIKEMDAGQKAFYAELLSRMSNKILAKRLRYLRDVLGIYPDTDFSVTARFMAIPSSIIKKRIHTFNKITRKYKRRFNFNLCPELLVPGGRKFYDGKIFNQLVEKLEEASQKRGLSGLRAAVKKAALEHSGIKLRGEILKEYYPHFQDPAIEFVNLQEEFDAAQQEYQDLERMTTEERSGFEAENTRLRKRFAEFFMARMDAKSQKEREDFYKKHKKPAGFLRSRVSKNAGAVVIFTAKEHSKKFHLGDKRWDPEKGKLVSDTKGNRKFYSFIWYKDKEGKKDKDRRWVWVKIIILGDGRRGALIYLHKKGKLVGFNLWNEEKQDFDRVIGPQDICYSEKHAGSKDLLRLWLRSKWLRLKIRIKGKFRVVTKPSNKYVRRYDENGKVFYITRKTVHIAADQTPPNQSGISTGVWADFDPIQPFQEPEAVIEGEDSGEDIKRVEVFGRGRDGKTKSYGLGFYRWNSIPGTIYTPEEEMRNRFSNWNSKDPTPNPIMFTVTNQNGEIAMQRLPGNLLATIYGGRSRGLKKGDILWAEFFHYKYKDRWRKAARIFKLNKDLVPVCEVHRVWYDEDKKKFNPIEGFEFKLLDYLERLGVSWKIFWFGRADDIAGYDTKGLTRESLQKLILEKLKKQTMTAKELVKALNLSFTHIGKVNLTLKHLVKNQEIAPIGYGRYAYIYRKNNRTEMENKSGYLYLNRQYLNLLSNFVKGDRLKVASEGDFPIILYEVVGKKARFRKPIPLIVQRDARGDIIARKDWQGNKNCNCFIGNLPGEIFVGRTYLENMPTPDNPDRHRDFMDYELHLSRGIDHIDNQINTATLFFDGKVIKEIHIWRGCIARVYRINSENGEYKVEILGEARPRKILRNLDGKRIIRSDDPDIESWDDVTQFTENELKNFIWRQLEIGPKAYKQLIASLEGRKYLHLDVSRVLNFWEGPHDNTRIVRLPDGRYAACAKKKVFDEEQIAFDGCEFQLPKSLHRKEYVWAVYEKRSKKRMPIVVKEGHCDFSSWGGLNYYLQFRDETGALIYVVPEQALSKKIKSPIVEVDNIEFPPSGEKMLLGGKIGVSNLVEGRPVGKYASLILKKDRGGRYYIKRIDYWDRPGMSRYVNIKRKGGGVIADIAPHCGVPNYSVTEIEGNVTTIGVLKPQIKTYTKRKIISGQEWRAKDRDDHNSIKEQVQAHLKSARSCRGIGDMAGILNEYHRAFMLIPGGRDDKSPKRGKNTVTREDLIKLSCRLCLDEACRMLDTGQYRKAQRLFETADKFAEGRKRFNNALAKARVLAAYYDGMAMFDDGDYELAKERFEQALYYRESLGANFINREELESIKTKMAKAEKLCDYMRAKEALLKEKDPHKALKILEGSHPSKNGLAYLRLALTVDIIKDYMEKMRQKQISPRDENELDQAIEDARTIIVDMHRFEILPEKSHLEKTIERLKSKKAQAILRISNRGKGWFIKLLLSRLEEILSTYDEIINYIRESEAALGSDLEHVEQDAGEDATEGGYLSATSEDADEGDGFMARHYLSKVRDRLGEEFRPLSDDEYERERDELLKGRDDITIFGMLEEIVEEERWQLAISFILKVADLTMFTDDTAQADANRLKLEEALELAIAGIEYEELLPQPKSLSPGEITATKIVTNRVINTAA